MSTIVFAEMPAYGHVNPSLPVVRELVRRGEQVIYDNTEEFRPQIEQAGATFHPYPAGILTSTDIAEATQSGNITKVVGVILRATESLLPFMLDELPRQQPDVVVYDSNALWGRMAATKLNLPTVSLMTTFMLGQAQFAHLTPREWIHMLAPVLPSLPGLISARSRVIRSFGKSAYPPQPTLPMRGGLTIVFIPRDLQPDTPHAAVFITHGGMNSVLEGLYYGVPLILIPQQVEQLMIGLYVAEQGAGLVLRGHVAGKRVTSGELRHSLERILAESRYREAARALQTSLRASGGYRQAADEIQAYIARAAVNQ
jgi:UDP:flavonoid glycosyltransferase YjiC (YdhE family)